MKSIEELLKQKPIYLNDWAESKKQGIYEDFGLDRDDVIDFEGINILFASYDYRDYEGDAYIIFEYGGGLYEVDASHNSYSGLDDFNELRLNLKELKNRLEKGTFGYSVYGENIFAEELKKFIGI